MKPLIVRPVQSSCHWDYVRGSLAKGSIRVKRHKVTLDGVHSSLRRGPVGSKGLNQADQNPF